MIAWCGSRAEGLGWLSDRCGSIEELEFSETLSIEAVDAICNQHPRRLILSVESRLSYPSAEIRHLQRSWPEVPWALAVGSWFDGSRRTGIGSTRHLTLPWYRWWDGWRPWVGGMNAELLNPWPQTALIRSRDISISGLMSKSTGVILSNCAQTAEGWQAGIERDPDSTHLFTVSEFRFSFTQATGIEPDWILWDDTCLDTFVGPDCLSKVCDLIAAIRERYSDAVILTATSMPRWTDWQQWMLAGANELIAKPSHGILLSEVLQRSHT
jgi:hypothetical protein